MPPSAESPSAVQSPLSTQKELGAKIRKAGATVLIAHLLVRIAGWVGKNVIPNHYGLAVSEAFTVVNDRVLNMAFMVGEQCLAPAYLPVFTRAKETEGEARAWRYTSILFNLQFLILLAIVGMFIAFPESIVNLLTSWNSTDEKLTHRRDLFVAMLPYAAPGLIGMSLASLTYVVLNGYKEFFFAALGDSVLKLSIVGGALCGYFLNSTDWRFVAGGAVAGGTLKFVTHLFALRWDRLRLYVFSFDLSDKYVRAFVVLVVPLLAGILISQVRDAVMTKVLTREADLQQYTSMGRSVVDGIQFIIPYTLSIALLPFFCDLSAREDNARLGAVLTQVIRMLVWFFVPVSIALAVAALPIALLLFSGKNLAAAQLQYPAMVTKLYALQLPFAAIEMMTMQAFFSSRRVIAPTLVGFVFSALSASVAWFGVQYGYVTTPMGIITLVALSLIVARILKSIVLVGMLRWTVPVLPLAETAGFVVRLAVAGAGSAAAAYAASKLIHGEGRIRNIAQMGVISAAAMAVFVALSLLLKLDEPKQFWRWTQEKLRGRGKK